ncbi:unnamed protein product [Nyctereutes procyonoides]|uniref:(raccoon dog) hypothetical protein n=1 Tax=Nyctereutes procyonoides TaxID=34880 RepID=A0A811Z248_NYCPR|nr:unnamed protein product [Nyctereutes procyonoides]
MTDKAEESAVGARSQMKRPGKPIIPPPCKRTLRMTLLSAKKGSEGASHPRGSAMSLEDDDPRVRAMSVSEVLPDKLPMPMEINIEIKEQLKKAIQQFGGHKIYILNMKKMLKLLEGAQVPPELWRKYVVYAMKEAARFQRQDVISHLENQDVLDTLESDHFLNKDIHTPNLNSPQGSDQ